MEECKNCDGALAYMSGDGVEVESWVCIKCDTLFEVPIQIVRVWAEAEEV